MCWCLRGPEPGWGHYKGNMVSGCSEPQGAQLRSKNQDLLSEGTGRDPQARGRNVRQWWPVGSANGLGRHESESLPENAGPLSGKDPARRPASRLMAPPGSRAAPNPVPGLPSSLPGSPAPPQVAAQSPPPPQPRERMAGTEFNRHHQQPPGKPGKVDTLIPVTVPGDQAQGRMAGGPTPRGAWPLPGRCHGEEPI